SAPGLGSNVSSWLGPPCIHSRMTALSFAGFVAAPAGSRNRPESAAAAAPPNAILMKSRRPLEQCVQSVIGPPSVVEDQFGGVDQDPVDVLVRVLDPLLALDIGEVALLLVGVRRPRDEGEEDLLEPAFGRLLALEDVG